MKKNKRIVPVVLAWIVTAGLIIVYTPQAKAEQLPCRQDIQTNNVGFKEFQVSVPEPGVTSKPQPSSPTIKMGQTSSSQAQSHQPNSKKTDTKSPVWLLDGGEFGFDIVCKLVKYMILGPQN